MTLGQIGWEVDMRLRASFLGAVTGMILLAGFATGSAQQKPAQTAAKPGVMGKGSVGQRAPEILRQDLNKQTISLAKLRGRVVLVNFWASWCGPCLKEMPRFDQLTALYGDKNFAVIGISIDDDQESAQKAVEKLHIHYPVAMGDVKLGNAYGGVLGVPISYLIDRKGIIRARFEGEIETNVIEQKILALINQ